MTTKPEIKLDKRPPSRAVAIFRIFFGLPFIAIGIFACFKLGVLVRDWREVRQWSPTDARIISVDLRTNQQQGGETHEVECTYEYTAAGETHRGSRVGLQPGADNIGSWQTDKHAYLKEKHAAGQPVTCLVDPADPRRAVLFSDMRPSGLLLWGCVATVFLAGGGVAAGGGWASLRRGSRRRLIPAGCSDQAWMGHARWADGVVRHGGWRALVGRWALCVFWNGLAWTLTVFFVPDVIAGNGSKTALVVLLFPAAGLIFLAMAIKKTIVQMKFGRSELQLRSLPAWIGGCLQGELLLRGAVGAIRKVRLVLSCVRTHTHGAGDDRTTDTTTLWTAAQEQTAAPAFDGRGLSVAVDFGIPAGCVPWDDSNPNDKIEWILNVKADVPGVDLDLDFPVPVFADAQHEAQGENQAVVAGEHGVRV